MSLHSDSDFVFSETAPGSGDFVTGRRIPKEVFPTLPAAVYRIVEDPNRGIVFTRDRAKFTTSPLTYDENGQMIDDIIELYDSRLATTVAYLRGSKGRGKTTMCMEICNRLIARNIPTIMVDKAIDPFLLRELVKAIGHCVILIDEFERKYHKDTCADESEKAGSRSKFLEVFTDKDLKRTLFLLADNNTMPDESGFLHRPDRINYLVEFHPYEFSDIVNMIGANIDLVDPDILFFAERFLCISGVGFDSAEFISKMMVECGNLEEFVRKIRYRNACTIVPMKIMELAVLSLYEVDHDKEDVYYTVDPQKLGLDDEVSINITVYEKGTDTVVRNIEEKIDTRKLLKNKFTSSQSVRFIIRGKHCEVAVAPRVGVNGSRPGSTKQSEKNLFIIDGSSYEKIKAPRGKTDKEGDT